MSGVMRSEGENREEGEGGSKGEKKETIMLNGEFKEVSNWKDACYSISPSGDIELILAGDGVKAGDSAYPIITVDEVLTLGEILKPKIGGDGGSGEEGIKSIGEMAEFLDSVSKRYKEYLRLGETFYGSGNRRIEVSALTLPKEARDEITAFFDLPLRLRKQTVEEGVLLAEGVRSYGNTQLSINIWNAEKCKQVGTKKKTVKKEVEITPAVYETVEEEVEVPVYECLNGKVIE